jgi:hypothetical protein
VEPQLAPEAPQPNPANDRHVRRGAGAAVLSVAAATVVGGLLGGPAGAGAGFSLLGAVRNTYRSAVLSQQPDPELRAEAGHSGIMAMIGFALGGYLAYHAITGRRKGPQETA